MRFGLLLIFVMLLNCSNAYSQAKNEDDLKKQANTYFENDEYNNAYKLYSQLVSLYPKDAEYNYRLGVCMLFTEPDKKKPYSYLKIATNNTNDAPKDAKFYLAKTYHINYRFDDAIKLYEEYKTIGSQSAIKKLQVDREIEACRNGKRLLSNLSELIILNKKQLNEADYFRSYDVKEIGGKLLVKPEEFKTAYDKKKKDKSVIYISKNSDKIYYSSYGENGNTDRDIYVVTKLPNSTYSKPVALPSPINTEFDDDYPFLHPNGNTLYFSSKGHNSMGGYDVFKTSYDIQTQTWSKPKNLDFPINSPDDDILYLTDSLEKIAFFSTGRYSPYGKIDVLKVNTERRPPNMAIIKGTVVKEDVLQSLKSKITIKNIENGEIVGTFQAQDNGDYNIEVPNGGKFIFTVETPGLATQSDKVQMPFVNTLTPFKQKISYDNKILKIINYFDAEVKDDNYASMIDLIEKKAKLELNEIDTKTNNGLQDALKNQNADNKNGNLNAVGTTNPSVVSQDVTKPKTNLSVTNEQLINIAKDDAKEASDEAVKLKQDAQEAFGLATQKTAEATEKQTQANAVLNNANSITDINKKNEELEKASNLKEDANIATSIANTATNLAKKLEVDANQKQKEADLTNEYIKQLEAVTKNKNNKEALTKLEQIQKELDVLSKQKNQSDELYASLKAEADLKQNELLKSEKKSTEISTEINTIKTETKNLENDLANENDAAVKENIQAQIRELTSDVDLKNKELVTNNKKNELLKNEVEGLTKEIELATTILKDGNQSNVVVKSNEPNGTVQTNNSQNLTNTNLSYDGLKNKYANDVAPITQPNNKTEIEKQTNAITTYNKEVTNLIALDKNTLVKTTNATDKKKLNDEIINLQKLKTDNDKIIATNNAKLKQTPLTNTTPANNGNETPQINNTTNAITPQVITASDLKNKYANDVTPITKPNNKTEIEKQNNAVTTYNKEVVNLITLDKITLVKTTNATEKKKITDEIAELEKIKQANDLIITDNEIKLKTLETTIVAINTPTLPTNNNEQPISNNENAPYINQLNDIKNNLKPKTEEAQNVFAFNNYADENSKILKNNAQQQFDIAKQAETNLERLITKTETNLKITTTANAEVLANEAEAISNKGFELRTQSATKTGAEKDALLQQAIDNEKQAIVKKMDAALAYQKQNQNTFNDNQTNIEALQKLSVSKTSNEISQANMLASEAEINFKQAQKIRNETNLYPTDASKIGGYSNAQEKENEAIIKQKKVIELLIKANPGFVVKTNVAVTLPNDAIAKVNSEVASSTQKQLDAYLALSKANQNELKFKINLIDKNQAYKATTNQQIKDLKLKADKLIIESQVLVNGATTQTTLSNKAETGLNANKKEVEALTTLDELNELLKTEPVNLTTTTTSVATIATLNTTTVIATTTNPNTNSTTALINSDNKTKVDTLTKTVVKSDVLTSLNTTIKTPVVNSPTNELNNKTELVYTNSETKAAIQKMEQDLNIATNEEKVLNEKLTQLNTEGDGNGTPVTQEKISFLETEAENYSKEAFDLRKLAETKIGTEKENNISKAKELEGMAVAKKIEAANSQQQLNTTTINTNKENLEALALMAKGKTIPELNLVETQLTEINQLSTQAKSLREEANAYANDAAKIGGYSNATEKEQQAIDKQTVLLETYKKYFSNFVPKQTNAVSLLPEQLVKQADIKTQLETNTKKQTELLLAVNEVNDKEYKSQFLALPDPASQAPLKLQAQQAFKKSSALKVQANNTTDVILKKKLLLEANKNSTEALLKLNEFLSGGNKITTNTLQQNNNPTKIVTNPNITKTETNQAAKTSITVKGLDVKNTDAYTASKPIPIDEKMQDGLVFKVQIGAFKAPLPNNTFKGLTPVSAQTASNGYLRYMAGNFEAIEDAAAVKNDLKKLGYNDAFVVAYYNGQRVSMNDAIDKAKTKGQLITEVSNDATAGLTSNANIPRNNIVTQLALNTIDAQPVVVTKELEQMNGLLFTVQIGVFSKEVKRSQLLNLRPIYTEKLPNGLYRYTAGIYNKTNKLLEDKRKVVDLGVKDAFVSAYFNAKRVTFADGQKILTENNNLKLETENPIIFNGIVAPIITPVSLPANNQPTVNPSNTQPTVTPFTNGVTNAPTPTASNGVKVNDEGISYKVQIGAYKNQVPNDVASKFLNIKTWPVNNNAINGLYIYSIGNFTASSFAKKLRDEAVSVGITDAFIVVYKDGKKLYGAEATSYLNN